MNSDMAAALRGFKLIFSFISHRIVVPITHESAISNNNKNILECVCCDPGFQFHEFL